MNFESEYILFDIDGTIVRYTSGDFRRLHGNFIFPLFADMMEENGWVRAEAEKAIGELMERLPFWDYTDFISEFHLDKLEAYRRCHEWHAAYIEPYPEVVDLVKSLHAQGKKLGIVSNNPLQGCLWKLQVAGLADDYSSEYIARIFGTNIVRGCKCGPGVWQRVLDLVPTAPANIAVVGDNPVEDRDMPQALGCREFYLIDRATIQRGIDSGSKTGENATNK